MWSDAVTTRIGYTMARLLCTTGDIPIDEFDLEPSTAAYRGYGVAPWDSTKVTVRQQLYSGDTRLVDTTTTLTTDAVGYWSMDTRHKTVWAVFPLPTGVFRLYVTVRGPNDASWEDASNYCPA